MSPVLESTTIPPNPPEPPTNVPEGAAYLYAVLIEDTEGYDIAVMGETDSETFTILLASLIATATPIELIAATRLAAGKGMGNIERTPRPGPTKPNA